MKLNQDTKNELESIKNQSLEGLKKDNQVLHKESLGHPVVLAALIALGLAIYNSPGLLFAGALLIVVIVMLKHNDPVKVVKTLGKVPVELIQNAKSKKTTQTSAQPEVSPEKKY